MQDRVLQECIHVISDSNDLKAILENNPVVVRVMPEGTPFARAQDSEHDAEPRFYNKKSDSRFGSADLPVGVLYLGFSDTVAVAEVFQPQGDDTPVAYAMLQQCSLHQLVAVRDLRLIDLPMLANLTGLKLRDVIRAKGQGFEGYGPTRALSKLCMECGAQIDGLLYISSVYSPAGTLEGCNAALFDERGEQVKQVSHKPLLNQRLSNGKTAVKHLQDLGVSLE